MSLFTNILPSLTREPAAACADSAACAPSATLKPAKMFGKDYTITEAQVIIRLQRLVAASGLQILPIVLCTTVAFITMFVSGEADGKGGRELKGVECVYL